MTRSIRRAKKIATTISGSVVLVVGVILIPYPGPGWLVVFMGLAILAREYTWAARVLEYAKSKFDDWNNWIARQNIFIRSLTFIGTTVVVIATLWLLNVYGQIDKWFNLGQYWVYSPFVK